VFQKYILDGYSEIIGNEAAEDENPELLYSYFVSKNGTSGVLNIKFRYCLALHYKQILNS